MTVTKEMIMQVSPFSVSDSGDFDKTDFEQYKTWAALELDQLDPGLDTATYDYCHALLICHIYDISSQSKKTGFKSEKMSDYSYTKEDASDSGSSSYYKRFHQVIGQWGTEQATKGVARDDADATFPKKKFKSDQSEMPGFD